MRLITKTDKINLLSFAFDLPVTEITKWKIQDGYYKKLYVQNEFQYKTYHHVASNTNINLLEYVLEHGFIYEFIFSTWLIHT